MNFNEGNNIKIFGSGMKWSEPMAPERLKLTYAIDRNLVKISFAKGNKQRNVMLPKKLKSVLKNYIELEKPEKYLFSGRKNKHAIKSVQKIFESAAKKAGIKKKASCHTLRHSFATHLLEKGIDIRYIQGLPGHSRLQTSQVYTHVANSKLKKYSKPIKRFIKSKLPAIV